MKRLLILFGLIIFSFSCEYRQVGWDELAGSDSSIPQAAPADGSEDDVDPWIAADDEDDGAAGNEEPSDGGGKGDDGTGGKNEGAADGNEGDGDGSAEGGNAGDAGEEDEGGEGDAESPNGDAYVDARLKFSLAAKDAATKRTYMKHAGTLRAEDKTINAAITKKTGDESSFYGVTFYSNGDSNFAGFLMSTDGNILIGKMKGGKWNDLKRIHDCEFVARGLNRKNTLEVKFEEGSISLSVNSNEVHKIQKYDLNDLSENTYYGIMAVSSGAGVPESITFDIRRT